MAEQNFMVRFSVQAIPDDLLIVVFLNGSETP